MRKVFVSYYHGDQQEVNKFVNDFSNVRSALNVGIIIEISILSDIIFSSYSFISLFSVQCFL